MVFWSFILSLRLLFLIPDVNQERNNIIIGTTIGAVIMLAFVICFICVIVSCIKYKRQLKLEKLRQTGETNREELRQTGETNREELRQTGETNRENVRQTEETDRVEMQEVGKTNRETIQAIKEMMQSLINQGMSAEETKEYLSIFTEQVDYAKQEATKKKSRVQEDAGDETSEEDEKQKIYADFLKDMREQLCELSVSE